MNNSHHQTKQKIRQQILSLRQIQSSSEKSRKEIAIHQQVLALPIFQTAQKVLLYASFKGEVSLKPIKEFCIQNKKLILPKVIANNQLSLHQITNLNQLQPGFAQIPEVSTDSPTITTSEIDFAIIPGVAFDKFGNRVGFGQGYYDRLLQKLSCPIVAVAFDFQVIATLPTEPHDQKVNYLITETNTIKCN